MSALQKLAPVKVNLCLHVGPVRADGLHDLASMAVFPDVGDRITVSPAEALSLTVEGPFADQLADLPAEDNLVIKATRLLQEQAGVSRGAIITLTKSVPAASGIGGGTSDAMTALYLLHQLWDLHLSEDALYEIAFRLGADGPVCLFAHLTEADSAIMTGAGETVIRGPDLSACWMCLVNPLQEVPTGQVFSRFDEQAALAGTVDLPDALPLSDLAAWDRFMAATRNDLQPHAIALRPDIAKVLAFITGTTGCISARMSGSGATCFGLYEEAGMARQAEDIAREKGWWAASGRLS